MPHRCAFGCKDTGNVMHSFPNPSKFPERFKAWVDLVGCNWETLTDNDIYKKKKICDIHFTDEHRNRFKRLNALAMPTLYLPAASRGITPTAGQSGAILSVSHPTTSTSLQSTSTPGESHGITATAGQSEAILSVSHPTTSTSLPSISTTGGRHGITATAGQSGAILSVSHPTTSTSLSSTSTTGESHGITATAGQSEAILSVSHPTTSIFLPSTSTTGESCSIAATTQDSTRQLKAFSVGDPSTTTSLLAPSASDKSYYTAAAKSVMMEHNYSVICRLKQKRLLKDARECMGVRFNCLQMRPLQTKMKYLQNEIGRLRKKGQSFKARLANAEKLSNEVAFQRVTKNMTKPAQLFVHMQLQSKKKSKGRRFSIEEKVMSLSLFKKSPKCYRLLCKYFALPSTKAMKRLLSQIKLVPGINPIIFEKIKKMLNERDVTDRLCSLMFDEMSITPQILYNSHKDELEGFASNQEASFADHALVFMVKGVKNNFKQPIAYYFTNGLKKNELQILIKTVVQHALQNSLIVVNTVCDQSPVNVGAITELVSKTKAAYLRQGKEWRHDIFRVNNHTIIPLYDTPHLIKGLRNNLLTKDMTYVSSNKKKTIKWEYYQRIYAADKSYGELRLLNKITEEHVNPEKINKMRVKLATQIFSHSVAVVAEHLTARKDLPEECRQIIEMTLLIDNLFDTLNGSSMCIPNGKVYKGPVKVNSPHHELWKKAKKIFKTVKYIKKIKNGNKILLTETTIPSVTNLIKTIEGMEYLWKVLFSKYGLDAMLTRNFNQDPVENFFGNIRSYGARNNAPNTVAFEGAFKALLLNNFSSPHSSRANCEEDSNECLQTLDFFLREKIDTSDVPEDTEIIHFNTEICVDSSNTTDAGQRNYVCGWVLRKCLKDVVKGCQTCKNTLLENTICNENNTFIRAKEYENKRWLCYPSKDMENYFNEIQNIATSCLRKNVPKKRVKHTIISFIDMFIDCPNKCPAHNDTFKKYFLDKAINVIIYSWCRSVNRILVGKLVYDGDDETKTAAQIYYNKNKNYKNRK